MIGLRADLLVVTNVWTGSSRGRENPDLQLAIDCNSIAV